MFPGWFYFIQVMLIYKMMFVDKLQFLEELQVPVYGGKAYTRKLFFGFPVQLVGIEMPAAPANKVKKERPLGGHPLTGFR